MKQVVIVGRENCTFCKQAVQTCNQKGIPFSYKTIHDDIALEQVEIIAGGKVSSVPQIYISEDGLNTYIGGFSDFRKYLETNVSLTETRQVL